MNNLLLKSNLLNLSEVNDLEEEAYSNWNNPREAEWTSIKQENTSSNEIIKKAARKIINSMVVDFNKEVESCYGLEYWININKRQRLHCDCDEILRLKAGIMRYPICSSVYFLRVPPEGGELVIHEQASHETINEIYTSNSKRYLLGAPIIIKPEFNQLVIFNPRMPHYVKSWKSNAERITIAANLWAEKPAEPNKPFEKLINHLKEKRK